jgi:hypothetical protein
MEDIYKSKTSIFKSITTGNSCYKKINKQLQFSDDKNNMKDCIVNKTISYYCRALYTGLSYLQNCYRLRVIQLIYNHFKNRFGKDEYKLLENYTFEYPPDENCDVLTVKDTNTGGAMKRRKQTKRKQTKRKQTKRK